MLTEHLQNNKINNDDENLNTTHKLEVEKINEQEGEGADNEKRHIPSGVVMSG